MFQINRTGWAFAAALICLSSEAAAKKTEQCTGLSSLVYEARIGSAERTLHLYDEGQFAKGYGEGSGMTKRIAKKEACQKAVRMTVRRTIPMYTPQQFARMACEATTGRYQALAVHPTEVKGYEALIGTAQSYKEEIIGARWFACDEVREVAMPEQRRGTATARVVPNSDEESQRSDEGSQVQIRPVGRNSSGSDASSQSRPSVPVRPTSQTGSRPTGSSPQIRPIARTDNTRTFNTVSIDSEKQGELLDDSMQRHVCACADQNSDGQYTLFLFKHKKRIKLQQDFTDDLVECRQMIKRQDKCAFEYIAESKRLWRLPH